MAEVVGGAVLSSFLGVAFDRLSSPDVVNWIKGKKLDKLLATLKTTLYAAQALLNDAENKQIKDTAVKNWLDSLKDVVYKADDLLDEVSTKAATQKGPGSFVSRYLNLQDREIANRMEDIIETLESILKHKDALGLKEIPEEDMSWRITTSLVKISDIYGRDNDKEAITKLLLENTSDGEIAVIPIVGQGGIGKTTLAQLVYNDDKVKKHFDFQAWVCISEEFDVIKVTRTIIEAITHDSCHTNDLNLLQHDLNEKLSRRKFLVVLDDAWNENYDDWIRLLKPFQQGVKGSAILITTRSRKVASVVQTVPPHELSLLSREDCWLVFAKHALLSADSIEYPTLEKIGREIVNKCDGLPLAAQTLGGLLRGNCDARYWNHILKSEIWEFSEGRSQIISALRISYYYLPPHLKECFVFCSLYPKDYEFDKHELILLWIAENYILPEGRKTLEEVGSEYFDELVVRSFLQQLRTNLNAFVMHDLMHDLAMLCAREFYFRVDELGDATEIGMKTRHLSHNAKRNHPISTLLAACENVKHARTFILVNFNPSDPLNMGMKNASCILLSQLKYLRVLSFIYIPLESLPDSIGELIHLRYLDLSGTLIMTLPESLSNLYNLQTLKLLDCRMLEMLPSGMKDLVNLRYLDIRGTCLKEMPKGMSKLKHLQFLSSFIVGKHEENGISELGALSNLHESLLLDQLENVTSSGEALKARMSDKEHIMDLTLCWSSDDKFCDSQVERDILEKLQPHKNLIKVRIERYMGTHFSDWLGHSSYRNMTQLNLNSCRNCCRLPSLGQLPSLKSLFISDFDGLEIISDEFYESDESCCETPFPSLEKLRFLAMCSWREWHSFKLDAFPRLKELTMEYCPMLTKDLPNHLPALEKLTIVGCKQLACSLPRGPVILDIRGCDEFRIHELPLSLRSLSIGGSQLVESAFEAMTRTQPTCLKYLFIEDCSSAISFPGGSVPASLEEMRIAYSRELEFPMQQQQQHEFLRLITIFDSCDSLTSIDLGSFPNLTGLTISGCANLKSLVMSGTHPLRLRGLTIFKCPNLVSFPTLGTNAPNLESLSIVSCPEIDSFPDWVLPPNLTELVVRGCEKLLRCLTLMDLRSHSLTRLEIIGPCESMKSFPKSCVLPASLEHLRLSRLQSLQMLDCRGLLHLASFKQLDIGDCPTLENIVGERLPASLTQLRIKRCPLLAKRFHKNNRQIWPKISHIKAIEVNGRWIH